MVLTPKMASLASSAANETTATFDLTHKRDKSNIIYQKPNKTDIPIKSNLCLVMFIDACAYIPMFILLTTCSTRGAEVMRPKVELMTDATLDAATSG
jgi:hypothetical protein